MKIIKNYYLAFMLAFPLFLSAQESEDNVTFSEVFNDLFDQIKTIETTKSQSNPHFGQKNKEIIQRLEQQAQQLQREYFAELQVLEKSYLEKLKKIYDQIQALSN